MKLKKVVSLALAGIMAVSMLAACGEGTGSSSSSSSSEQTVVSGAAAIMNAAQDTIEFKDSTTTYLADAVKEATYNEVNGYKPNAGVNALNSGAVYTELDSAMPTKYGFGNVITFSGNVTADSTNMKTCLYAVNGAVSEEVALSLVARAVGGNTFNALVSTDGSNKYDATYAAEVSVQKVTKTEPNGTKTASAYYVLVTVTQTVGKTALGTQS